jgi:membrane protein YdbS with pleckstrin-like domain
MLKAKNDGITIRFLFDVQGLDCLAPNTRWCALIWMICFVVYFVTMGGHLGSTDEEDLFHNTAALAQAYQNLLGSDEVGSPARDFTRHPLEVGQSVLALPWYVLGQWLARLCPAYPQSYITRFVITTFNICITATTVALLYLLGLGLWESERAALSLALLYGFASLAWPYSQTFYREPLTALALTFSFGALYAFRQRPQRKYLVIAAGALLLALATKLTTLLAVPWLLAYSWAPLQAWLSGRPHSWLLCVLVLIVLALVVGLGIAPKHETLLHYLQEVRHDLHHHAGHFVRQGVWGLLFSPGKGLLLYAPPVLLALLAFAPFVQCYPREGLAIAGLSLSYVLAYGTRRGWHGGLCWGPRYLLPVLPLMLLPVGVLWAWAAGIVARRRVLGAAVGLVGLVGALVQLGGVAIYPANYYVNVLKAQPLEGTAGDNLEHFYLDWDTFPIAGHLRLAVARAHQLMAEEGASMPEEGVPSEPSELWQHFIHREGLDFWWAPPSICVNLTDGGAIGERP